MFIFEQMIDTTWKVSVHVFVCAMGIDFASNYDFLLLFFVLLNLWSSFY